VTKKVRAVRGLRCNLYGATRSHAHRAHWKLIDDAAAAYSLPHLCAAFDRFVARMVTAVTCARTAVVLWACCFSAQAFCVQADSWLWQSTTCKPFCARQTATVTYLHTRTSTYTWFEASALQKNAMLPVCRAMGGCLPFATCMQLMNIIPCLLCQHPHLQHQKDTADWQRSTRLRHSQFVSFSRVGDLTLQIAAAGASEYPICAGFAKE